MDNAIMFGVAIIFLFTAIVSVSLKNSRHNQEKDVEYDSYKQELDRLEERLQSKQISKKIYDLLRKNLDVQHQLTITKNIKRRSK